MQHSVSSRSLPERLAEASLPRAIADNLDNRKDMLIYWSDRQNCIQRPWRKNRQRFRQTFVL